MDCSGDELVIPTYWLQWINFKRQYIIPCFLYNKDKSCLHIFTVYFVLVLTVCAKLLEEEGLTQQSLPAKILLN